MFGQNPKLPPELSDGNILKVVQIFHTIQGEGPFVGMPAIFIRLAGCNLACTFCDTEFDEYTELTLMEIIERLQVFSSKLIVITGGEPLRQSLEPLCKKLLVMGYRIQIETNGTLYQRLPEEVHIVCSPKSSKGKYYYPHQNLLPYIDTFKFIISQSDEGYNALPIDMLADVAQDKIYLQPMDQYDEKKNSDNLEYTIKLCMQYGYKLSIQMHKVIGME